MKQAWGAIGLLFIAAGTAFGGDPAPEKEGGAQQLFFVNTAYVEPKGLTQLTLRGEHFQSNDAKESSLSFDGEVALCDRFQIEFGTPVMSLDDGTTTHTGIGDVELGCQALLTPPDAKVMFAVGFSVSLPTGDAGRGLGEGVYGFNPKAAVTIPLDDGWFIHSSVSGELNAHQNVLDAGIAVEKALGDWSFIVEFAGSRGNTWEAYIVPGVEWRFAEGWAANIGVPVGLTNDSADWGIIAQVYVEF